MGRKRRDVLKALGATSVVLTGCSGDKTPESRKEKNRESVKATLSDEMRSHQETLQDYQKEFRSLESRYPGLTSVDGHALLDGIYTLDSSNQQFVFREALIPELSPEEDVIGDRISYERIDTREFSTGRADELDLVNEGYVDQILGGEKSIRAPIALKLDTEKGSEFTGLRSPSQEVFQDLEQVESLFAQFRQDMAPIYNQITGKEEGSGPKEAKERLAEEIERTGSRMYSLKHGIEEAEWDLPGIRNYSNRYAAGMQSMLQGRVTDGGPDINGDGEIDLHDAHALSWLKDSPVFQEAYGRRLGEEGKIGSEQVIGFAEDTSFFDGQTDDAYRVFYEQGEAESIEGAIQAIKASDFLQGGDGNPEIEVVNKPVDVEGETPQELLDDFNSYADSTSADYNILLASGMEDLSTTGYSEVGGEHVDPVQRNAGVILEPGELDKRGVPLATSSADGVPISYVTAHEISHAKGGKHYDMVVEDAELNQATVSLVDIMYDGHRNTLKDEISDESDAVCFLPVALDDYMTGF